MVSFKRTYLRASLGPKMLRTRLERLLARDVDFSTGVEVFLYTEGPQGKTIWSRAP